MTFADVVEFLTSKTGAFAALTALLAAVATSVGLVQQLLKRRREAAETKPRLVLSHVRVKEPPPWSEAGEVAFELANAGGARRSSRTSCSWSAPTGRSRRRRWSSPRRRSPSLPTR